MTLKIIATELIIIFIISFADLDGPLLQIRDWLKPQSFNSDQDSYEARGYLAAEIWFKPLSKSNVGIIYKTCMKAVGWKENLDSVRVGPGKKMA